VLGPSVGCYYGHLAVGQGRLLWRRQPIEQLLAAPDTSDALRIRLRLVQDVRRHASELGLSVGEQYTSYVAWPGDRIVTTIVATRPGEVEAAGFRFPLLGVLPYKGFFELEAAEGEAAELRADGLDVCVVPIRAYSTLGWLADPVTEPMLAGDDLELVETLLHELVHATAYVDDDTDFNESVASFVGREAAARYVGQRGLDGDARSPSELEAEQRRRSDDSQHIAAEVAALRKSVAELYARELAPREQEAARSKLERDARERVTRLDLHRPDATELAQQLRLGDACLALQGAYSDDLPLHAELLDRLGGDLPAFVDRLRESADSDTPREAFFASAPSSDSQP